MTGTVCVFVFVMSPAKAKKAKDVSPACCFELTLLSLTVLMGLLLI